MFLLFCLFCRGAAYADDLRYQKCIDLWRRALEIRVEKDSVSADKKLGNIRKNRRGMLSS